MSSRLGPFTRRRWLGVILARRTLLYLALIAAAACFLRSLRLFNPEHYYLFSPDSHFFHWLAARIVGGAGPPPDAPPGAIFALHSGLAYPLAYAAKAISSVFGVSSGDALVFLCKAFPLILALLGLAIVYLAAARVFNRRVALFAALTWALLLDSVFIGSAGFVDRDELNVLLVMLGAILFIVSKDWHPLVARRDVGWLVAGVGVLVVEAMLYLEWSIVGSMLLLVLLVAYFVAAFLLRLFAGTKRGQTLSSRFTTGLEESNWRVLAVAFLGSAVIAIPRYSEVAYWLRSLAELFSMTGKIPVAEFQPLDIQELLMYAFFLIPIAVGLVAGVRVALKGRADGPAFFGFWFLFFLVGSFFSSRLAFFMVPPACFLSGLGLMSIWDWAKLGEYRPLKTAGIVVLLLLQLLISIVTAAGIGQAPPVAIDTQWREALAYLEEKTPQDAMVMSQWSWGYWILDVGQRRPFVDNGYYGYDWERLHSVGLAYTATEPAQAAEVMRDNGTDFLLFSKSDLDSAEPILEWAGLDKEYDEFPEDSLVVRSLGGSFQSGGGLEVLYRPQPDSEIVILGLTQGRPP